MKLILASLNSLTRATTTVVWTLDALLSCHPLHRGQRWQSTLALSSMKCSLQAMVFYEIWQRHIPYYIVRLSLFIRCVLLRSSMPSSLQKPDAVQDGDRVRCSRNGADLSQLLSVAVTVLRQGLDLVENVLSSDEQLTVHSKHLPGSTIGLSRPH